MRPYRPPEACIILMTPLPPRLEHDHQKTIIMETAYKTVFRNPVLCQL
jgi:hypothetical protein